MHKLITATCLAAASTVLPLAASAGEPDKVEVRIPYHDIDVTTAEGSKALKRRINAEARKACTFSDPSGMNPPVFDYHCFRTAKQSAISAMNSMRKSKLALLEK